MSGALFVLIALQGVLFIRDIKETVMHPGDHIQIYKSKHLLVLKNKGVVLKKYPAAYGFHPGKKERVNDKKTPEGHYKIIGKNSRSVFYRSLHINYPNEADIAHAKKLGVDPGNEITIHGTGDVSVLKQGIKYLKNTTRGCVLVSDQHIHDLYQRVAVGTPVDIYP